MNSLVLEKLATKESKLLKTMQPVDGDTKIAKIFKECANELSESPILLQDAPTNLSNIKPKKQSKEVAKARSPSVLRTIVEQDKEVDSS